MGHWIDTDFRNNVAHIRPYLGVLLIASIALMFGMLIYNALMQFTHSVSATTISSNVEGELALPAYKKVLYGDTIEYVSSVSGVSSMDHVVYFATVCF